MAAIAGCNRGPAMSEVSGTVFYTDGSVPRGGVCVVRFEPLSVVEGAPRKGASGAILPDGTFELTTRVPGDGVYHGEYAVTFAILKAVMDPKPLVAEKYRSADTTPFKVTVDGDKTDLKFELEPLPGVSGAKASAGAGRTSAARPARG